MRRYTRLSNGFSRKLENHVAAVASNYFVYNFWVRGTAIVTCLPKRMGALNELLLR
jgi:hypothetical protein